MIFFFLPKQARPIKDFSAITTLALLPVERYKSFMFLAWNEIFPSLENLQIHVLQIALQDPVCVDICNQAWIRFGIDPCLQHRNSDNFQSMQQIVHDTFFYWAHPLIGNIANSPRIRPADPTTQYTTNWKDCTYIDGETKDAIQKLLDNKVDGIVPLPRSGRDQARICYNTTELARAIIGEIACVASRKLEKLLALRLCQSAMLLEAQNGIIMAYMDGKGKSIIKKQLLEKGKTLRDFEYCYYYFSEALKSQPLGGAALWYFVEALINSATEGAYEITSDSNALNGGEQAVILQCITDIWKKLPVQVRCAILMNDLVKIYPEKPVVPPSVSLGIKGVSGDFSRLKSGYTIIDAADKKPHINLNQPGWSLIWSWNRNEYHDATISYRHSLCPLWAGPSGHAGRVIKFWMDALGKDEFIGFNGAITVACGLFALWRLYYDKRITGTHTLAETFEATCLDEVTGFSPSTRPSAFMREVAPFDPHGDAYNLVDKCVIKFSVDPICLIETLRQTWNIASNSSYTLLDNLVNIERDNLNKAGFQLPQWSQELSVKTGLNVQSFSRKQTGSKSAIASLMALTFIKLYENGEATQAFKNLGRIS